MAKRGPKPKKAPDSALESVRGRHTDVSAMVAAEAEAADQSVGEVLRRSQRHLQNLQAQVEAESRAGRVTTTLLRESSKIAASVVSLSKEIREEESSSLKAFRAMSEEEKDALTVARLIARPFLVRQEAHRQLAESLQGGRR